MQQPDLGQARWRKSSHSNGGGECVEIAQNLPGTALLRDSKLGEDSPTLAFTRSQWGSFLDALKSDRLDD
ncbi:MULTISPECIES: DUF397 domain-containing protein [unclassified Actinopolyspora]|uniref:DUF397 domain-containing protein n=1 Tax=unclassified Actinopolyspora TaxID=2639451 RepID=UPI0013F6936A|nr:MULTISPECIES: DUF397 domain-containing protein [unclassified Actinopolyspora]NHD16293.1 DUF397 domain-containing protein [Actinopolyspora sp. BKK2]NHE75844.1 DUF397 domain-containing protein [Actinopolyspora sp. BKK1]